MGINVFGIVLRQYIYLLGFILFLCLDFGFCYTMSKNPWRTRGHWDYNGKYRRS